MDALNYHHLLYFSAIAEEGGLLRAARRLRLSHSTLSAQLRALEDSLGAELFERRGRRLVLTPFGAHVASYAGDIFRLGRELLDFARGQGSGRQRAFRVGLVNNLPRSIGERLLRPAFIQPDLRPLLLRQGAAPSLLAELVAGRLHAVITEEVPAALSPGVHVHPLGETEVMLHGTRALARRFGRRFPGALSGAPLLVPATGSLRRGLEAWFADRGLRPSIVAEVEDAGMLRVLGGGGLGLFPVRDALRTEVEESLGAVRLGDLTGLREAYYMLSIERRLRHPGVAAIAAEARLHLAPPRRRRADQGGARLHSGRRRV